MRSSAALVVALLLWLGPAAARADSIGGPCPSGQTWQSNPVAPGSMHHGGGQCVPDPNATHGCSVAPGPGRGEGGVELGLVVVAAVALGRRVRVRSR